MAKRLLAKILEDVLGDFISGFSNENLKLGVFGGKIEFTNLILKPGPLGGVLKDLNAPVAIMKGFLKHVHVTIPWTSLGKSPVIPAMLPCGMFAGPTKTSPLVRCQCPAQPWPWVQMPQR